MATIREQVQMRTSQRTYLDKDLPDEVKVVLDGLLPRVIGPFHTQPRFELVDTGGMDPEELRSMGTYGFLKGGRHFIVGSCRNERKDLLDFGHCMERIILQMTGAGMGTCWLGGTFDRAAWASRVVKEEGEVVPAITPLGHVSEKRSIKDRGVRFLVKSAKRKPWEEIIFDGQMGIPLDIAKAGRYEWPLECLRLAPSASNKQPWRIVVVWGKDGEPDRVMFYLLKTPGYEKMVKEVSLQTVDMGIAMCHFDLVAREEGVKGHFSEEEGVADVEGAEYVATWTAGMEEETVEEPVSE